MHILTPESTFVVDLCDFRDDCFDNQLRGSFLEEANSPSLNSN